MDKEVQGVLGALTEGITSVFEDQLTGIYLTGSLSYGDFDPGSSDIDFTAIVKTEVTDEQRQKIAQVHHEIGEQYPNWATRVDGSYLTQHILSSVNPPKAPRPFINGGRLWHPDPPFRDDWLINIYNLRTCSRALCGADPVEVFPEVDIEKVREACKKDLNNRWAETVNKAKPFEREGYDSSHLQAYAVLTMCRVLYFINKMQPASKRVASTWAKGQYPEWNDVIAVAEKWQHGDTLHIEKEAKEFIEFTLRDVGSA